MAIVDLKKDYVAGNKTNFGGALGKSTSKKEDSSFLGNLAYIGGNTAAGFGGVFEGIGRLASSGVAKLAGDDRLARYYAKKSYIGEWQSDMAEKYSPDKVTQFFADAGAGVGQSSVFLLNLVAPGAGTVVFGAGIFGNSVGEAVNKTGQLGFKEYAYGGLSAGGEYLMEKISGATFKAVGRIGAGVTGSLTKNAVETTATQTAKKGFLKAVASNAVLKDLLKESSGEFIEEFLGDFWDVGISRLTGVDPEASTTIGQAIYSGMVGFASGAMMSGSSMVINRAAAASRGYHINESGNAQQMVRTAEVVLEEAKTAENFQDPAGVVDMLKESVESYNAQKDKTNFASRVALGQMQMFTAYIEKNIGVMQAYANIMKADAQTLEQYASLASYYSKENVTTKDLLSNRDNIAMQMAIRDWVNGVLTVDLDHVAEAQTQEFIRTTEGGNTSESAGETRFSMTGDAAKQKLKNQLDRNATVAQEAQRSAQATEITQTSFDDGKSVQNVHIIDGMYLSIKKNSDGTYNYAINDKSAKQDANGGVWDKTNVPAEEMRQYFEQAKEGAVQYEAQKAAQTAQEAQTGTDRKTTAEGENAAQEQESAEKKAQEKPRQKSEIDSATEKKLNKMIKGFNTMAYRDRAAVSRMVKSAEANGVNAKTIKKIAIAMTARSGLDIRFTKSISQNGTWTVFKDGSQRRLILLNPDIQSPLEQTFLHEFLHDMMNDKYINMESVINLTSDSLKDGVFDKYIEDMRDEYFDANAKAGREGLILTKNEDGTVTRSFATKEAENKFNLLMREEAAAHFGANMLYERNYATRLAKYDQNAFLRTFRAIGRWVKDVRSRDVGTASVMEEYLGHIEDAVAFSKDRTERSSLSLFSQTAETKSAAEESETRFELAEGERERIEQYEKRVDAWDKKTEGFSFVMCNTTSAIADIDMGNGKIGEKQIRIDASKIKKILNTHPNMTIDTIKALPYALTDPVLVMQSRSVEGRIVVYGEVYDTNGVPVQIAMELNPRARSGKTSYVDIIKVASAYSKSNTQNFINNSKILYTDKNKSRLSDWLNVNRLQLPLRSRSESALNEASTKRTAEIAAREDNASVRNQHISPPSDVQTPNPTSETVGSMNAVSNNSIHQKSENVKGKSKNGENTRFELKIGNQTTPVKVQETKNLIAIHNLSEQKLLDTLALGGFPMPSIAVVKADQGHSNYGDISVIFGRDTIDPKMNRSNKLYGSDAYTPTGSSVEYKVNRDAAKQFSRELSTLARGIADGEYASDVSHAIDNLGDTSSKSFSDLIDSMSRRTGFQAAYLQSKGETVQPVYYKREYSKYGIEAVKNFIDILGSDAKQICLDILEGDNSAWKSQLENVKKAILDKYNDDPKKRALLERTIVSRYGASQVYDLVGGTWAYLDDLERGQYGGDSKEVDRLATAQAIEEKIDFDDFRKWLMEKADGILGKKGIRNNKDPFTPTGNRRSFEQLHDDFTIDNIMRDMKKNQQARGQGTFGATAESVAAVATPEYKSISDMKKDSARLKIIDDQAYTQIKDDIGNQIVDIITDIKNANKIKTSNDLFISDAIGSLIVEGGRFRSADSIVRYFANGGYTIDRNMANRILDVYRAVSAMPTGYFEAKPQRVVNFSEIKMVELPESASDTLKKQLERRKIPYEVYGKTDEDRATAVKKLNDVRFELNSGTGYSRGQMSKIVANRTKGKVYSLSDAAIAIDNVTALVSGILSDENISFRAKIRGKSRAEVMDFLFEQMNKEQGNGRLNTALQAADYILNHAVVQEELDSVGREEYARMMDIITGMESYRRKFKFTETEKADLKHMFDKGYPSLLRAWSSEDGMMPSRILTELKDSGITVDSASDVESDIFADLLGQYQNAKQAIKQWNESVLLNTVGDKRMLTKLKSDMAHEILKAFETTGEKSAYRKEVEARQEAISKMLEKNRAKLDASRKRSRSEYQLYRAGIDLEQRLKRDKRSNKLFQDVGVREIANAAVKLAKPRNARNPAAVLSFAKTMQGIYSPKNPLLAIYGEVDKKTGEYENTYYNPEVGDALNRLTQIDTEVYRRGKKVKNKYLTDAQVIDLQTVVSGIDRLYREYDTVYYQGKRVGLTETAQQGVDNLLWIEENRNKKGKKWYAPLKNFIGGYLRETVSPLVVVRNLEMHDPNGVLSKYYEEVVRGDLNTRTMTANLMDTFEKFYKENKGYQKALARDTVKFMGFEMSKAQAITLYCTMKSEHARLGFETFGFTYEDKNGNLVETGAIKNYDIKILYNAFNETDKRFISIVEQFFNETSRKIKTETDMRVIGSTNVLEDYYFPILRDRKQRGSNVGDMRKAMMNTLETVNNISANQNRIEHADGRLDIYDVTAIIERHAVAMATYANLYEPIQSFERVLNARVGQRDENGKLIRQTETTIGELMEKLYPGFRDSFTKLFGDIQGVKASREGVWDTVGKGIEKAQGLYASAVVSGNIKTAMLPPMSMFAAGSLIDMKYLSRSLTMNNTRETRKASYAEMEKYSSVIKGRYYDRGAIKARTVQDSVRGLISVTGKGIEITEKFMINKLWSACKLQTSEQLGLAFDSDENCRAAAKLFDKVVTETQSQYVPSMKSSLARHNNVIVRGFTQFKSDGQAMLGSLYDNVRGYFDLKERKKAGQNVDAELKAAKKRAARSIPSIAAVCVGVAIITQGMRYLFNNDDEDDETPVKNIAMNTLNSAMGMFPLVGDVYSVFAEGYDISNMTLDALNDGVNGIKAMTSLIGNDNATQADVARATRKALYGVGHMAGVPVRNLTNLTTGVIRRISKPTMYGYDSIFSGEKYSEDLQRAVKRGDDKMAEAITKVMFRRKKTGAYNQETLDEVLRLYKAGYDKKVMPGGIPDDLTRAQRKTFLNVYGKSDADVQKLIESDAYKAFDDEQKASAISSLYRSWRAYAKYQAIGETDDKSALLSEVMGADKFGKARAYLSGLKAKEDAETPKDGWRSTIQKGLKGMGLTSDEQALMLYAAGYHSASDLSSFLRVLNAKNLTKEQLALFAEIFKLDVKNGKLVEERRRKKRHEKRHTGNFPVCRFLFFLIIILFLLLLALCNVPGNFYVIKQSADAFHQHPEKERKDRSTYHISDPLTDHVCV